MQFIRIRCFAAVLAMALAATVMSASAASARVDGPLHQSTQTVPAPSPAVAPATPEDLRAAEASGVLGGSYGWPRGVRVIDAQPSAPANAAATRPKVAEPSDGFDWGDAVIGGAIALALVSLVTVGTLAVRRRAQPSEA
jgi:hypothetical protein